jgi:hypothetical protein
MFAEDLYKYKKCIKDSKCYCVSPFLRCGKDPNICDWRFYYDHETKKTLFYQKKHVDARKK